MAQSEEIARLAAELTSEQLEFANLWITKPKHGMTDAECYMKAYPGSSPSTAKVNSSRLVRKSPKVMAYLAAHQAETTANNIASLDELKVSLTEMARADITDVCQWDIADQVDETTGEVIGKLPVPKVRKFEDVPPELRRMIKSITYTKAGPKIELYDRQRAMDMLIKMQGGYTEKVELSGPNGGPILTSDMTPEEATAAYRASL